MLLAHGQHCTCGRYHVAPERRYIKKDEILLSAAHEAVSRGTDRFSVRQQSEQCCIYL